MTHQSDASSPQGAVMHDLSDNPRISRVAWVVCDACDGSGRGKGVFGPVGFGLFRRPCNKCSGRGSRGPSVPDLQHGESFTWYETNESSPGNDLPSQTSQSSAERQTLSESSHSLHGRSLRTFDADCRIHTDAPPLSARVTWLNDQHEVKADNDPPPLSARVTWLNDQHEVKVDNELFQTVAEGEQAAVDLGVEDLRAGSRNMTASAQRELPVPMAPIPKRHQQDGALSDSSNTPRSDSIHGDPEKSGVNKNLEPELLEVVGPDGSLEQGGDSDAVESSSLWRRVAGASEQSAEGKEDSGERLNSAENLVKQAEDKLAESQRTLETVTNMFSAPVGSGGSGSFVGSRSGSFLEEDSGSPESPKLSFQNASREFQRAAKRSHELQEAKGKKATATSANEELDASDFLPTGSVLMDASDFTPKSGASRSAELARAKPKSARRLRAESDHVDIMSAAESARRAAEALLLSKSLPASLNCASPSRVIDPSSAMIAGEFESHIAKAEVEQSGAEDGNAQTEEARVALQMKKLAETELANTMRISESDAGVKVDDSTCTEKSAPSTAVVVNSIEATPPAKTTPIIPNLNLESLQTTPVPLHNSHMTSPNLDLVSTPDPLAKTKRKSSAKNELKSTPEQLAPSQTLSLPVSPSAPRTSKPKIKAFASTPEQPAASQTLSPPVSSPAPKVKAHVNEGSKAQKTSASTSKRTSGGGTAAQPDTQNTGSLLTKSPPAHHGNPHPDILSSFVSRQDRKWKLVEQDVTPLANTASGPRQNDLPKASQRRPQAPQNREVVDNIADGPSSGISTSRIAQRREAKLNSLKTTPHQDAGSGLILPGLIVVLLILVLIRFSLDQKSHVSQFDLDVGICGNYGPGTTLIMDDAGLCVVCEAPADAHASAGAVFWRQVGHVVEDDDEATGGRMSPHMSLEEEGSNVWSLTAGSLTFVAALRWWATH